VYSTYEEGELLGDTDWMEQMEKRMYDRGELVAGQDWKEVVMRKWRGE
jgi:hypothetical protein